MRKLVVASFVVCVLAGSAAVARAGDEQPVLPGYTRCGIQLAGEHTWHLDVGEGGALTMAWTKGGLSCTAARRNTLRVLNSRFLRLPGYRCVRLRSGLELLSGRCTKRDRSGRAFRFLTGA